MYKLVVFTSVLAVAAAGYVPPTVPLGHSHHSEVRTHVDHPVPVLKTVHQVVPVVKTVHQVVPVVKTVHQVVPVLKAVHPIHPVHHPPSGLVH